MAAADHPPGTESGDSSHDPLDLTVTPEPAAVPDPLAAPEPVVPGVPLVGPEFAGPPAEPAIVVSGEPVAPFDLGAPAGATELVIGGPPARSRRRLAVTLTAVGVVAAVLIAGGALAAVRMWKGPTGAMPEDAMPASVGLFARIDLSPGLGQRVKFEALLKKTGTQQVSDVTKSAFDDLDGPISYADVAPWFDDRLGLGLWAGRPGGADQAVTLLVAASKDNQKARVALTAAQQKRGTDKLGFVIGDDYVLLAMGRKDAQAMAAAAAAEAKKSPLAKAPAFRSAVATLPSDQPLLGWADLAQAGRLTAALESQAFDDLGGMDGGPTDEDPAVTDLAAGADLKGTLVLGAQAVDGGLEVRARIIGGSGLPLESSTAGLDVIGALGGLPAEASAAGVLSGPLTELGTVLGEDAGYLPLTLFGSFAMGLAGPGAQQLPPELLTGDEAQIEQYFKDHPELLDGNGDFKALPPGGAVGSLPAGAEDKLSKALSGGLATARTLSFAAAGKTDEDTLQVPLLLDLQLPDAAAAKKLQTDLADLPKIAQATCEQHDEHVSLRSKTYAAGNGKLADSALFKEAMAGGVANPTAAVYLDGKTAADTGALKAIGITTGRDGADTVILTRIIIK